LQKLFFLGNGLKSIINQTIFLQQNPINMLKNKSVWLTITAVVSCSLFYACTKNTATMQDENLQTISNEKQLLQIDFAKMNYAESQGIIKSDGAIKGNTSSYLVSKPIAINVIKEAAPFISLYGIVDGEKVDEQHVKLYFAGSTNGNTWSEWIDARGNVDVIENIGKFAFSGAELDGNVNYLKFKVNFLSQDVALKTAQVYIFNPKKTDAATQALIDEQERVISNELASLTGGLRTSEATTANPALCAKPNFTTRSTWGARAATSAPSYTTVNFLAVHHEEGSNSSTDWTARVRAVQNLHMDVNGWADIGYNYVIAPTGVAYDGRGGGENVTGAHLCGKNGNTMGVCMLGSYTSVLPTNNAQYTLKRVLAWKCKQRGLSATGTGYHVDRTIFKISGHRSSCSTDCPGNTLFNFLPTLRTDIATNFLAQCQ
jgi:hypothetical protein